MIEFFVSEENDNMNHIPKNVTHLTFGYDFNQFLKVGVIPNNVTHLTYGLGLYEKKKHT